MAVPMSKPDDEAQFRIEATGYASKPRSQVLKSGDTFAVLDPFGDMVGSSSADGLYHEDTRFLSQLELRLNGDPLLLLSSNLAEDDSLLSADLANPDTTNPDGSALQRELIYVNRRQFIWQAAFHELVLVRNYDVAPHTVELTVGFASDFVDVFEVRGLRRQRHGQNSAQKLADDTVALRYRGLDRVERVSTVRFEPAPARLDTRSASFTLQLAPGEWTRLVLRVDCTAPAHSGWDVRAFYGSLRSARQATRRSSSAAASVSGSNAVFNELVGRSMSDLYMLITQTPHGPYPYAGIPWYSTVFGRDGIITALMMLWLDPSIAKGVLQFLAATQATEIDRERDAEPGKILHEMRHGEMARLGEVPFGRYYGTVDATPLFVMLMGAYFDRTGDLETMGALWPHVEAALGWIDTYGDRDKDGFVEYERQSGSGLSNQGWKDSQDAIFHADGALAQGAIALVEVQGYVFAAKRHAAVLARALGQAETAARLDAEAERLRQHFEEAFWCEELSTYALALDGAKRPCKVVASNAGHALLTGIAAPDRARRVADTLLGANCFTGWGVRTVAANAARFNPISYHNGSIWPHDNGLIAIGLARYGFKDEVQRIFTGLFDASSYWEPRRLPELFCGFVRRRTAPTLYPVACAPQAWASACVFALVAASLGLHFDRAARQIRFECPRLPDFLDHLHLRNLQLDGGRVDVLMHRHGGEVAVTVAEREGDVRVVITH